VRAGGLPQPNLVSQYSTYQADLLCETTITMDLHLGGGGVHAGKVSKVVIEC
jgi:hypothetical protein